MVEIEDQWMVQWNWFDVICFGVVQYFEQLFVVVEGGVEVGEDLLVGLFSVIVCQ